jgi:hypothetical protein
MAIRKTNSQESRSGLRGVLNADSVPALVLANASSKN